MLSDDLQIFIDKQEQKVDFSETFTDPVSKLRVSNPKNLIDTDFEYGLQPTKWETVELVNNVLLSLQVIQHIQSLMLSVTTTRLILIILQLQLYIHTVLQLVLQLMFKD